VGHFAQPRGRDRQTGHPLFGPRSRAAGVDWLALLRELGGWHACSVATANGADEGTPGLPVSGGWGARMACNKTTSHSWEEFIVRISSTHQFIKRILICSLR
jgi:hypothetical protein